MDEVGEFVGIADEEDGGVVADHIPVAFFGVEFDGKAAHITFGIRRAAFPGDSGETKQARGLFADF